MIKGGYVYIVTNKHNTNLYIGVTSGLEKRLWEHRSRIHPVSFASRYNLKKLVHFQAFDSIDEATVEQERIMALSRLDQVQLIETANSAWNDLGDEVQEERLLRQLSLF